MPARTAGGNTVTISGGNFVTGASVHFGAAAAKSVTFVSARELKAVAPAHRAGVVDVGVANSVGSSSSFPADA